MNLRDTARRERRQSGAPPGVVSLVACLAAVFLLSAPPLLAQKGLRGQAILPNPEPFSVNSYHAIQAVAMIRREQFLQHWDGSGMPETIVVERVESTHIAFDAQATPAHQHRYDILVNGEPLDWDHTYIEYDGRMTNLRLLFTYRNQHPPTGLLYHIPLEYDTSVKE